ncbi:MAG TPA: FxsB family cyclophane-forming radical SAM/SPASM peptide maturase [Actinophytocola sp.]|uniref:FxsB family cyclophane-forming radical SAM/SPASM peptide maturase n=1 Tax=Actinophytocola sp. TaxID=1872138 RepID=UPI002DDD272D|nr:FxsB family cyclophane-forming radical SAM/SPASM peptide maturase [Actinophytocola sp.]HEV2783686.1 FxsB family cyclophane-forming radical SAM/SPASM peptide maturase [Actinophytocola sp.]
MPNVPVGRPLPFRQFIVKLHSRCNLACDYCYLYTKADQRWRTRPRVMSRELAGRTAERVAEHVRAHRLDEIEVILHGGEPLLAGAELIDHIVSTMRAHVPARVRTTIQTNATLLDRDYLNLLRRLDIRVGVSLDGDAAGHDRHRIGPDGTGSYHRVRAALRLLGAPEYRGLFRGLLCTVDLANDPVDTYRALLEFTPPAVDFLLPHGNWTSPPPGRVPGSAETPYADWLITVFDRWYDAPLRETRVRLFEEIINVLLGGRSRVEGIGLSPALMVVIETDGTIEQSDILASAFEGAAATGLHVARDSFDAALTLPDVLARQTGSAGLPATCRACRLRTVCGGGLRAHRFRAGAGFDNPSVYCPDLFRLITHVRARLADDLAAVRRGTG